MQPINNIFAVILAGGKSSRMSGEHKANTVLAGKPLIEHVIKRMKPQVASLAVNLPKGEATPEPDLTVIYDIKSGYHGPLMGLYSALSRDWFVADYLCVVPCDGPFVPTGLVQGLYLKAIKTKAKVIAIRYQNQVQPMFSLWHRGALPAVEDALLNRNLGGFKNVITELNGLYLDWPEQKVDPFFNINTVEDVLYAEQLIKQTI